MWYLIFQEYYFNNGERRKMKGKIIIFCFLTIFLLLVSSSASAVEYKAVNERQSNQLVQIKEKLESLGCPTSLKINIWFLICAFLFITERATLGSKPVTYAVLSQLTIRMYATGVYHIAGEEPPPYSIIGFLRATPEEKYAQIQLFLTIVLNISIRLFIVNAILGNKSK